MNFGYKPGDTTAGWEIGTQKAYRFWRYAFPPMCPRYSLCEDPPVRLLSLVSDTRWYPGQHVTGTSPDMGEQGIHGFKTMDDLLSYSRTASNHSLARSTASGCDGVVLGMIEMWGIIWDHEKGYRAQFARPTSFSHAVGNRSEQALAELRAQWGFK